MGEAWGQEGGSARIGQRNLGRGVRNRDKQEQSMLTCVHENSIRIASTLCINFKKSIQKGTRKMTQKVRDLLWIGSQAPL